MQEKPNLAPRGRWPSTRAATPTPKTQALRCMWCCWSFLTAAAAGLRSPVLTSGLSPDADVQAHGQHLHLRSVVSGGRAAGDRVRLQPVMHLWTSPPCPHPPMPVPRGLGSVQALGPCSLSPRPRLVQPWWGRLPVVPPPLTPQRGWGQLPPTRPEADTRWSHRRRAAQLRGPSGEAWAGGHVLSGRPYSAVPTAGECLLAGGFASA